MRHRIIEIHQEMFNYNEHEVSKRWTFEEGVSACFFVIVIIGFKMHIGVMYFSFSFE